LRKSSAPITPIASNAPMMMIEVMTAAVTETHLLMATAAATIALSTITKAMMNDISEPIVL
jgi:hypothetical protein